MMQELTSLLFAESDSNFCGWSELSALESIGACCYNLARALARSECYTVK